MTNRIQGLHHVTAVASDAQQNVNFYTGVLGLTLVKQTIDYDNPFSYRLIYATGEGLEAPLLSFLIQPNANGAQVGIGQVASVSLSIPASSFGYWLERLLTLGIKHSHPAKRFGERYISLNDPDGLRLDLVADPAVRSSAESHSGQPSDEHPIEGIDGVSLWESNANQSIGFYQNVFGFSNIGRDGTSQRLTLATGRHRCNVDLVNASGLWSGTAGIGGIDHIAWCAADCVSLEDARTRIAEFGLEPSPVIDAYYWKSIAFDAQGGSRHRIATRDPGLTVDEPLESLGQHLQLPPWLESSRLGIESTLPPIQTQTRPRTWVEALGPEDSQESR